MAKQELTPEQEQVAADKFLRQCMLHVSNATDTQKRILLRTLLSQPADLKTLEHATAIWNGLRQDEIMQLLAIVQKQFDKETWEFISRWRQ